MQSVPGADHVTDGVYIGAARTAYRAPAVRKAGIRRVLKLYYDDPFWPPDFVVCENPLHDGAHVPSGVLRRGVAFIHQSVAAGENVLVVCGAGISRSATFVLAYLIERGDDLRDAWQLLSERHPVASPAREMWESLITFYDLPYSVSEALGWVYDAERD